jgi:hypothetical protein
VVYVRAVLGPTLQREQSVVLDHRAVHQAKSVREANTARGGHLWDLPAYSPDRTPIEEAISPLQAGVRRRGARTREAFLEAIGQVVATITAKDGARLAHPYGVRLARSNSLRTAVLAAR